MARQIRNQISKWPRRVRGQVWVIIEELCGKGNDDGYYRGDGITSGEYREITRWWRERVL